ncbi:anti-phage deoxyguanosine triphosphatase [Glaciecola siphonariae]|uniref:Deoxyguanosinetriphosphate triphosphohydrolase-like protein n=1 Tax=Glaciecola siphonariae TaxID=521012 RepID=A0ABV9LTW8_9ALTE
MNLWEQRKQARSAQRDGDHRSPYQRDKARIMHCAAFRRLQAKTQVVGVGISDFYRTRLTHSLEAAQIGTGITAQLSQKYPEAANALRLDEHLIESICLAHDIGHPPFGHGGEIALHYMMSDHGGFEGNGQTFRILTKLESYSQNDGMNLARRSLLGIIKYPNFISELSNPNYHPPKSDKVAQVKASMWHPPKALFDCDKEAFDWVVAPLNEQDKQQYMQAKSNGTQHSKTLYKSIDCAIMELADDIAYGIHDLEDAIVMGLVNRDMFNEQVTNKLASLSIPWLSEQAHDIEAQLFHREAYKRKNAIGALVNCFITAIEIVNLGQFDEALLDNSAKLPQSYHDALLIFKAFVFTFVIKKPEIQLLEYKGQQIVMALFEAFASDPARLLPRNTALRWEQAQSEGNALGMRVIADYISGMTDEYANRVYANLFLPKSHRITDR